MGKSFREALISTRRKGEKDFLSEQRPRTWRRKSRLLLVFHKYLV
jgi:hypothetical protein